MVQDFGKLTNKIDCQVEHWYEAADTDDFVLEYKVIETLKPKDVSSFNSLKPKAGFTFLETKEIKESSQVIFRNYYKRNVVRVTFDTVGGGWDIDELDKDSKYTEGKYGSKFVTPFKESLLYKARHKFAGWEWGEASSTFDTFPAESQTIFAKWETKNYSTYKVNYWVENLDDDNFTLERSEYLGGESESLTNLSPAEKEGFDILLFNQITIKTDDSAVLDIKYSRHRYKFTFILSEDDAIKQTCKWNDNTSASKVTEVYKYGSKFDAADYSFLNDDPVRGDSDSGWGFSGWNKEGGILPETVTGDQTFVAQWAKPFAKYSVITKIEKIGEPGNYDVSTEEFNGSVGKLTDVTPNAKTGYSLNAVTQKVIEEDDSTQIEVVYNLATVTISFNPDNGCWDAAGTDSEIKVFTGKYGQQLEFTDKPSKELNEFLGWIIDENSVPVAGGKFVYGSTNETYYAKWNRDGAWYKADYYLQNLEDDEYELVPELTTTEVGRVGASTNISIELEGYEYREAVEQKQILADDSTTVKVYLKRKIYTATFDTNGGRWSKDNTTDAKQLKGKYQAKFQKPGIVVKDFHTFAGWSAELPDTYLADATYTAQWDYVGADFTIKYLFEKLSYDSDANKYAEDSSLLESKNITGYKGGTTYTAEAPAVPGFTAVAPVETALSPDGSTVIEVKYNRNTVTYTFKANGGKWSDEKTEKVFTQKYGSEITVDQPVPNDELNIFAGWEAESAEAPEFTGIVGADNQTYKAKWLHNGASYKIEYYIQNIDDDEYTLDDDSSKTEVGMINTSTNVTAAKSGFTVKPITQQVIKADGTTVVKVYFDRNVYQISFNPNGGKWVADSSTQTKTVNYKYGAVIQKPAELKKADYKLLGWDPEIPESDYQFICEGSAEYSAVWEYTGTKYQINYRFEKLEWTDENDKYEIDRRLLTDKVDYASITAPVTVVAPAVTGFIAKSVDPVTLNEDGTTQIYVYYDRISGIEYVFDANGGAWDEETLITHTGKYGQSVPAVATPVRPLYKFAGWSADDTNTTVNVDSTFGTLNKTYKAVWYKYAANYTVVYKFQNIEDNEYSDGELESRQFEGEIDKTTEYSAPAVNGFKCVSIEQALIKADGSAVVNVKYDRNVYTIKLDPNGGRWNSNLSKTTKEFTGRYGKAFVLDDSVSYPDYKFDGWDQDLPAEFTEGLAEVYKAQWKLVGTKYKVEHYEENLTYESEDDRWKLFKSEEPTGSVTVAVKPNPEKHTGFIARAVDETNIAEDGSTVIKIYYDRISGITYSFNPGEGSFATGEDGVRTGKYGAAVQVPDNPTRQFYTFKGWSTSKTQTVETVDATFGVANKLYEAVWEELPTTEISGIPVYTGGEIVLEATSESRTLSVKVTVPYNGGWQFQWYDNEAIIEGIDSDIVDNVVSFTKPNMSKGRHKITVYAKDPNGMVKSAFVTVVIE